MYKNLDPLFLSQSRLAIVNLLYKRENVEFTKIKALLKLSSGNLSTQIQKLQKAKFIEIEKRFKGNYPQTVFKITPEGIKAYEDFISNLGSYLLK